MMRVKFSEQGLAIFQRPPRRPLPARDQWRGEIVGEGRDGSTWRVAWDHGGEIHSYGKTFIEGIDE